MTAELELAHVEMRSLQAQLQLAQTEAQRSSIRMNESTVFNYRIGHKCRNISDTTIECCTKTSSTLGRGFGGALAFLVGR